MVSVGSLGPVSLWYQLVSPWAFLGIICSLCSVLLLDDHSGAVLHYRRSQSKVGKDVSILTLRILYTWPLPKEKGSGPRKFCKRLCVCVFESFSGERAHSLHPVLKGVHDPRIPRGFILLAAFSGFRIKIGCRQILTLGKLLSLRLSFLLSKMRQACEIGILI